MVLGRCVQSLVGVFFFTTEFFSTCHPDDRREEGSVYIHVYASTSALQILRFAQDDNWGELLRMTKEDEY